MAEGIVQSRGTQFLITAAAFVIVVAGMHEASSIIVPFLLAAFLAILITPPLSWLRRIGLPAPLAVLAVVAGVVVLGLVIGILVGTSLDGFSRDLPVYQARLQDKSAALLAWVGRIGVDVSDAALTKYLNPGAAMQLVANTLTSFAGVLTNAFLIIFTVVFILLEASSFPEKLRAILKHPDMYFAQLDRLSANVKRYTAIKTVVGVATGVTIAIWLAILGVDYPSLWGLLAFLLNYIPTIGAIIAAVPAVLLALITLGGGTALLAALGYLILNVIVGSFIEPRFMGRGLGLSTLVVFLSLVLWGWVLGPVGMLLSVPLTMTAKIALAGSDETKWIAILLGSEVPEETDFEIPPRKPPKRETESPGSGSDS